MVSGYNVPYTLDGGPVKLSLAGSARWQRREMRAGTREKAVVRPVFLTLKSNRNVEKATWFSGSSVRPFLGACFLVSGMCWPALWPPVPVLFCGSGPVVCSWPSCVVWFRLPGLFQKEATTQVTDPKTGFFLTDRPHAERALRGGRE